MPRKAEANARLAPSFRLSFLLLSSLSLSLSLPHSLWCLCMSAYSSTLLLVAPTSNEANTNSRQLKLFSSHPLELESSSKFEALCLTYYKAGYLAGWLAGWQIYAHHLDRWIEENVTSNFHFKNSEQIQWPPTEPLSLYVCKIGSFSIFSNAAAAAVILLAVSVQQPRKKRLAGSGKMGQLEQQLLVGYKFMKND